MPADLALPVVVDLKIPRMKIAAALASTLFFAVGAIPADAAPDVISVLKSIGSCGSQEGHYEVYCKVNGGTYMVVPGDVWGPAREQRASKCAANPIDLKVLTDGHWYMMVAPQPGMSGDLEAIEYALAAQGVGSEMRSYCP